MGTFTLTQNQAGKNLYIYPEGDLSTCTEFAAVGDIPNYACVDEDRLKPDDDATYVWWNGVVEALDLYELPNHMTEMGVINYVQIYARAKSHETAQHVDGVYKIICSPDSVCSHVYKSDDIDLTTSYTKYSKVWVDNPSDRKVLVLRPTANGDVIQLTVGGSVPATTNWEGVDEIISDEFITYNYLFATDDKYDLYQLANHTTQTEVIEKVEVFARIRKSGAAADFGYTVIKEGGVTTFGAVKALTTNWATHHDTYPVNPRTGLAWTWAEIDSLQAGGRLDANLTTCAFTQVYIKVTFIPTDTSWIWNDIDNLCYGEECSSPSIGSVSKTSTFRPNAAGDSTTRTPIGVANNWDCVNEVIADDVDYTTSDITANYFKDLYNIPNHTTETGTITKIAIFARAKRGIINFGLAAIYIKTGGNEYGGDSFWDNNWTLRSQEWAINPNTLVAWTWADIDALQIGFNGNRSYINSQLYVVVYYDEDGVSPEIRTTQCYAKVNYDEKMECSLNRPLQISTNHRRNIKMLNFWNGDREVYDLNRSGKSMVLIGEEMYDSSCDHILCIRGMARNSNIITISELAPTYFNGDYRIRSFGWNKISEKPEHYKWILELEDAN